MSQRIFPARNHSNENVFRLQVYFHVNLTHVSYRKVLHEDSLKTEAQGNKETRKWHITMIVIYTQSCCTYRLIGPREILSLLSLFVVPVRLFPCLQTRFTSSHCPVRNDNTVSMCRNTLLHSGIKSSGETICVLLITILIFPDPRLVSLVVITKFDTRRFSTQILCTDLGTVPEVQAGKN